jgi:hypothetical protein
VRVLVAFVLVLAVAAGAVGAVGAGRMVAEHRAAAAAAALASATSVPVGQDHACVVGPPPRDGIDWAALRNPVLSSPTHGYKDQALQWSGGEWHMLFTDMTAATGGGAAPGVEFAVAEAHSRNLVSWSTPQVIARGAASPDIVRDPAGQFVVTYQLQRGSHDQLAYRISRSPSLTHWSAAHALAPGLAGRMIDPALAWTGDGVILGFKAGTTAQAQHFEIAWAPSLTGKFRVVGQPDISYYNDTVENYEFVTVDGAWHLVATSNTLDQPFIFTLGPGSPKVAATWLHWVDGRQLKIPDQPFDTGPGIPSVGYEHANSAFLCVGPGGEDYLTFAASTELTSFGGWGHARIGLARSRSGDLTNWQVPPE